MGKLSHADQTQLFQSLINDRFRTDGKKQRYAMSDIWELFQGSSTTTKQALRLLLNHRGILHTPTPLYDLDEKALVDTLSQSSLTILPLATEGVAHGVLDRIPTVDSYTQLWEVLKDHSLSLYAKGLYLILDQIGWKENVTSQKLTAYTTDRRRKIKSTFNELVTHGYAIPLGNRFVQHTLAYIPVCEERLIIQGDWQAIEQQLLEIAVAPHLSFQEKGLAAIILLFPSEDEKLSFAALKTMLPESDAIFNRVWASLKKAKLGKTLVTFDDDEKRPTWHATIGGRAPIYQAKAAEVEQVYQRLLVQLHDKESFDA